MTESDWNSCTDPKKMLEFLGGPGRASERKLRLFACACCRSIWYLLVDERSRKGVAIAEHYADGRVSEQEMEMAAAQASAAVEATNTSATRVAKWAIVHNPPSFLGILKTALIRNLHGYLFGGPVILADTEQSAIIRDLFGNPFRPVLFDPAWRTPTALALAQTAYEERLLPSGHFDPDRLAVLSDALEEAGCTDASLLAHLRSPGPHVRGCWAVDLILGKS